MKTEQIMIKKEVVEKFISLSLNPVPIKYGEKEAYRKAHQESITASDVESFSFQQIGVSTGYASLNLEVLDFDTKNVDDPDKFMKDYNKMIPKNLLDKMVIQTTQSGGFHYLYRCDVIESSQKLARNLEGKATIETRGIGGYIKCAPSKGYKLVSKRTFAEISFISERERNFLIIVAKQKDELNKKDIQKKFNREDTESFNKFKTYNEDPDIGIELLENAGWTYHSENGDWYNFSRPNSESGDLHGGYNREDNFFQCFSTSQDQFEQRRGYNNHHLFAELECEGNYKKAYALLYEQGYGEDVGEGDSDEDKFDFISDKIEETSYLDQARKGEISQGLSTGWADLDEYFRLKPNTLNFGIGYDGVGKSVFMLSLASTSSLLHNWKWGMVMPENKTAVSRRRLIECKYGKPITYYRDKPDLFDKYADQSRSDFHIISNKKHYSMRDVMDMGVKLYETKGIDALLVDPWNFFKTSGDSYTYNNDILSEWRVFAEKYCSVYIMAHPRSEATRTNKLDGYLVAPDRYSIQGGADFPYRVDDFFSVHRVRNHEDAEIRKTMQFIMGKVKEEETGGKAHTKDEWTSLIWEVRDGFLGYWDSTGNNPMYKAMKSKMKVEKLLNVQQQELRRFNPEDVF